MGQARPHSAQAGVAAALEKPKEPLERRSDPRYSGEWD